MDRQYQAGGDICSSADGQVPKVAVLRFLVYVIQIAAYAYCLQALGKYTFPLTDGLAEDDPQLQDPCERQGLG